jgi:MFS family permease
MAETEARLARSEKGGILSSRYRVVTIASIAIVFLAAFENLGFATIMPVISRQLHGADLYAVAFAAPLAIGVVGMVGAGAWSDARGPRAPLVASVIIFAVGLVIAGAAPSMAALLVGRLVYGMAGGGITVTLYVVVGRTFPSSLQPQIFGAFAAAWILPALVGPAIAGIVAQSVGWRWVLFGVVVLVVVALFLLLPVLSELDTERAVATAGVVGRLAISVVLAVAVLGLGLVRQLSGLLEPVVGLAALAVAVLCARKLLPRGTLSLRPGIGGVIGLRTILAGAYFGAEIYLPYVLTGEFGLTPAVAGLSLTGAGVTWGSASWLQGRVADRISAIASLRIGAALVSLSIAGVLVTAAFDWSPWLAIVGWTVGGAGMGMAYPRLSVLMLDYSTPESQGFNSSALAIADAVGPAITLALLGVLFESIKAGSPTSVAFTAVFALAGLLAVASLAASSRVGVPTSSRARALP